MAQSTCLEPDEPDAPSGLAQTRTGFSLPCQVAPVSDWRCGFDSGLPLLFLNAAHRNLTLWDGLCPRGWYKVKSLSNENHAELEALHHERVPVL